MCCGNLHDIFCTLAMANNAIKGFTVEGGSNSLWPTGHLGGIMLVQAVVMTPHRGSGGLSQQAPLVEALLHCTRLISCQLLPGYQTAPKIYLCVAVCLGWIDVYLCVAACQSSCHVGIES